MSVSSYNTFGFLDAYSSANSLMLFKNKRASFKFFFVSTVLVFFGFWSFDVNTEEIYIALNFLSINIAAIVLYYSSLFAVLTQAVNSRASFAINLLIKNFNALFLKFLILSNNTIFFFSKSFNALSVKVFYIFILGTVRIYSFWKKTFFSLSGILKNVAGFRNIFLKKKQQSIIFRQVPRAINSLLFGNKMLGIFVVLRAKIYSNYFNLLNI